MEAIRYDWHVVRCTGFLQKIKSNPCPLIEPQVTSHRSGADYKSINTILYRAGEASSHFRLRVLAQEHLVHLCCAVNPGIIHTVWGSTILDTKETPWLFYRWMAAAQWLFVQQLQLLKRNKLDRDTLKEHSEAWVLAAAAASAAQKAKNNRSHHA